MIVLVLLLFVAVLVVLVAALFLLGFRLGGEQSRARLVQVRQEAAQAERQLHDLTRQAFVSMAEAAERRDPQRQP